MPGFEPDAERAREWMALRAQGRGRFFEGDAEEYLRAGIAAIQLGLVAGLSGSEQAAALRDIAVRTSRPLRDREVDEVPKSDFVRAVPKLLASAAAREATDSRMTFWELLLRPLFEGGTPATPSLATAIVEALNAQLASGDEILQWSARHGANILPQHLAQSIRMP